MQAGDNIDAQGEATSDFAMEIEAILRRDAAFYEVISRYGIRPVVLVGFDAPTDTRDASRKQADVAVLTAIRQSGQRNGGGRTHHERGKGGPSA
jgi:hypothetical protein